ncbi:MAG: hypothetical protein NTX53_04320 [candidate division WOR-3 bacterium]|nr:hypothetical protein [candidate division WOR-3 bacterium]
MAPRKSLIINGRKNDDLAAGGFSAGLLDHFRDDVLAAIRFENFSINEPKP